jgi:ATP-binding cassette subfamily B protein
VGKTTLAKSLGRTIEIPDGQLFLDDIDIKNIKLRDLRKHIAYSASRSIFIYIYNF